MRVRRWGIVAAAALVAGGGCSPAGRGASVGASAPPMLRFPRPAELAAIGPVAARASLFPTNVRRVDRWDVDARSLALARAPADPPASWLRAAVEALGGPGVRPSPPLACAARELGRFRLATDAAPAEGLRRHLAARCGSTLPKPSELYVEARGASGDDEALWRQVLPELRQRLAGVLRPDAEAAVAIVREGDRAVVVALGGVPRAELEPLSELGEGEASLIVRGTMRRPADLVAGLVNRGARGFARCTAEGDVPAPRFALRCPVDPADVSTWVSLSFRAPGSILLDEAAELLAVRRGASAPYVRAGAGAPSPARDAAEASSLLLARVNEARRGAGLRPLELAPAQSADNARLLGAFANALHEGDATLTERILFGLMAGWRVPGTIRRGDANLFVTEASNDAGAWLIDALERPAGRSMLLDPDGHYLALGLALAEGGKGLAALVTTYSLFDGADHAPDADFVFSMLADRRAALGFAPPSRVADFGAMAEALRRSAEGEPAERTLAFLNDAASSRLGSRVRGSFAEAIDLDTMRLPPEALAGALPTYVAVGVTHRRSPGSAWGHYVAFFVVFPDAPRAGRLNDHRPPAR